MSTNSQVTTSKGHQCKASASNNQLVSSGNQSEANSISLVSQDRNDEVWNSENGRQPKESNLMTGSLYSSPCVEDFDPTLIVHGGRFSSGSRRNPLYIYSYIIEGA